MRNQVCLDCSSPDEWSSQSGRLRAGNHSVLGVGYCGHLNIAPQGWGPHGDHWAQICSLRLAQTCSLNLVHNTVWIFVILYLTKELSSIV